MKRTWPLALLLVVGQAPAFAQGSDASIAELVARAKALELPTVYVPPPGDPLSHHTSGFAKIMCSAVFVTGYGSLIVPRAPFVLTFRPPRFLVEHGGKAVAFGATDGGLGFNPLKGASVEDVTLDVAEYPPVPVFSLHTKHFAFPIDTPTKVFSTSAEAGWRFELQLESASDFDSESRLFESGRACRAQRTTPAIRRDPGTVSESVGLTIHPGH